MVAIADGAKVPMALGAVCDAVIPSRSSHPVDTSTIHFTLSEFVDLDDDRRIWFTTREGFSVTAFDATTATGVDAGPLLTREGLERDVRNALLPDGDSVEDRPWELIVFILDGKGVSTSVERLRALPFLVEFGPTALALLAH